MRLKIAARKSDLARWQAVKVARALQTLPETPEIEFIFKSSFGDQNLDIPLAGMGAKGVFTEDFYQDLIDGQCDLVVHSWKDLPTEERSDTVIAMTLKRADPRDILMIPEDVWQSALKSKKLTVLTSSPRRVYNLTPALPKLLPGGLQIEFKNVRGNVPTRLSKMYSENAGLILAKAGLDRLLEAEAEGFLEQSVREKIQKCRFQILPLSLNPPAPAQGALAVEVARSNTKLIELCKRLNHEPTFKSVQNEREVLKSYGGGCHQKIGVADINKDGAKVFGLRGLTDQGEILNQWRLEDKTPWPKANSNDAIFPLNPKDNSWFDRSAININIKDERALYVARKDAWPEGEKQSPNQLIWAAGVQTWQKLASLGLFISGCSDGLGDQDDKGLEHLIGSVNWTKLSHSSAPKTHEKLLATYKLEPKASHPDLSGKTHFFWMSSTAFERAFSLYPNPILNGYNACGPGITFDVLKGKTGFKNPVKLFAGLEQFLDQSRPE